MTFGKSRYNKKIDWELLRYATKLGTSVVGGASKLFAHFVQDYSPATIISYCDLRWNTGKVYEQCGFSLVNTTAPNYWYTRRYSTFESRVRYQKYKLSELLEKFDPNQTEWDNMAANGYDRFWDCGNSVWHWQK